MGGVQVPLKFAFILSMGLVLGSFSTTPARGDLSKRECFQNFSALVVRQATEVWQLTPERKIPILVRGGDEASYQQTPSAQAVNEIPVYDTIVVGGGLSGLTAGVYLTDHQKSVLLLEKEPQLGGLAAGGERGGVRYARGAAYFSPPDGEQIKIFDHIGLGDYQKHFTIPEPIDSYLWNGKLYPNVWEPEALEHLPKSFALFRHALEALADRIPSQPIEDSGLLQWDHMTAAEWVRWMPEYVSKQKDEASRAIYQDYLADTRLDRKDPMKEVLQLLNLYSRSALGWETNQISATAFANFYVSEIVPRFTGATGSGDVANHLVNILKGRNSLIKMRAGATVSTIRQNADFVEVVYAKNGQTYSVHAKSLVFSAPLGQAPKLIEGFAAAVPRQAKLLSELEYAHYAVHNVFVEGHPWRDSYDLWLRDENYSQNDPTDVILGRWQDPKIHGYDGLKDFKATPGDDVGILTIYHPLPKGAVGGGFDDKLAIASAEKALGRIETMMNPILKARWGTKIKVKTIETNRWPFSIHIVKPGWLSKAKILNEPIGRIYLGNNNMGLPSVEEAMYRGKRAALAALKAMGVVVAEEEAPQSDAAQER